MANGTAAASRDVVVGARTLPELDVISILIVDDDPQARALIEMALADARFRVTLDVAPNLRTALERIRQDDHDLYLIDQQLPDGTGVDLIADARAQGVYKPFILLTGHGSLALDEEAWRAGAADYVEKHMVAAQLERSIRYTLRTWQATRLLHDRDEQLHHAQKMEAIGRLAGGVAHDFNNLLAVMLAGAELAAIKLPENDPARQQLQEVTKAGFTAAALVKQILAFGRRQELRPRRVDLRKVVQEMDGMLASLLEKRVELRREFAPNAPDAMVDPVQFQQVVLNLCVNARDAMPKGGALTLRVRGDTAGAPREDGTRDDPRPWATFEVEDTGTGMPPELLHRIFEPFFTTKAEGKGTGLGLATVHGIVKQSEGFLEVESEVGRGTLFRARFPVAL